MIANSIPFTGFCPGQRQHLSCWKNFIVPYRCKQSLNSHSFADHNTVCLRQALCFQAIDEQNARLRTQCNMWRPFTSLLPFRCVHCAMCVCVYIPQPLELTDRPTREASGRLSVLHLVGLLLRYVDVKTTAKIHTSHTSSRPIRFPQTHMPTHRRYCA